MAREGIGMGVVLGGAGLLFGLIAAVWILLVTNCLRHSVPAQLARLGWFVTAFAVFMQMGGFFAYFTDPGGPMAEVWFNVALVLSIVMAALAGIAFLQHKCEGVGVDAFAHLMVEALFVSSLIFAVLQVVYLLAGSFCGIRGEQSAPLLFYPWSNPFLMCFSITLGASVFIVEAWQPLHGSSSGTREPNP